jgi:acetyl esterase/lipase
LLLLLIFFCFSLFPYVSTSCNLFLFEKTPIQPFQACHLDPLLDDSITFARRLRLLSVKHHLVIIHNLPHGFLNFYNANNDCKRATDRIMSDLARQYDINEQFLLSKKKKRRKKSLTIITNPIINE